MSLPPLVPLGNALSPNAASAYQIANDLYSNACRLLASQHFDVHRVRSQRHLLILSALPVPTAMETSAFDEG